MLKLYPLEQAKELSFNEKHKFRYAITNYGRLISFSNDISDGRFLKGNKTGGYRLFRYTYTVNDTKIHKHLFLHKLVAENFLPKPSENHNYVLHINHNLSSDFVDNLRWATREEMLQHYRTNPYVVSAKRESAQKIRDGRKLTTTQVMLLKKRLANPNNKTRMKIIARQFGISEMQLYRIKRGENWGKIS